MSTGPLPQVLAAASPLGRRNPTMKLLVVFGVSLVALFVLDPVTPAVLYVVALAAVAAGTRLPARTLALAHLPFAAFALGLLLVNSLSRPGDIVWEAGWLRVTEEGISVGASLALRTLLIGVLAIGFVLSTDPVAMMTSLHQQARLGPRVTYAVLAGYRMLQEMPREWQTICQAHSVRAAPDPGRTERMRALGRAAFALLVVSVRRGERIARALEARGLRLTPRTTWRPVRVDRGDWIMFGGTGVILGTILLGSSILGFLTGPAAFG